MVDKSLISRCQLFSELHQSELDRIASIASIKKYSKGEAIFFEGDPANDFFIVVRGKVKVYKLSQEGRELILGIFGEGATVGEAAMFGKNSYPAYAQAMSDCVLVSINRSDFLGLLKSSPELSMRMIGTLSNRLVAFNRLIAELSLMGVQARVAKFLLDYSMKKGSNRFELEIKKQDLAMKIGTISETLSRVLRKFREKKIIDINNKTISILNRPFLQRISSGKKI